MSECLIFENAGEIDLRLVSTFGCSVKESANPIGFFGTGLKFALAVLLRTNHSITVDCGLKRYEVVAKRDTIRGKDFSLVFAQHGDELMPLGFTTELGKTWEVWMAYRELYCNAKDEPASRIYEADSVPAPKAGVTRIVVTGHELLSAHKRREEFILEGPPDYRLGTVEVYRRPSQGLFYKGIKVAEWTHPALFTYNQTARMELTEDRTAKDRCLEGYAITRTILEHAEAPLLEKVLVAGQDFAEHYFDFHGWSTPIGKEFFPTINALQRLSLAKVNQSALKLWREKGCGFIDPRRITPTAVQAKMMERAIAFLDRAGFPLRGEYPILIVETFGDDGTLAMADMAGRQILLSERVFQQGGTKGVARALAEEYLHLRFKYSDCTREMQNWLFDKLISLAEEMTGQPL